MHAPAVADVASRRKLVCLFAGVGAVGVWYLYGHPPSSTGWYPPCVFHELTGLHCPGCGATRAAYSLIHGRFTEALHQNALLVIALPFLSVVISRAVWRWMNALPEAHSDPSRWLAFLYRLVAAIVILFGIARNLPWWPFQYLAPF